MPRQPLSVVVCTLNEEAHIGRLLASVRWADEVLVLDCGSTDRTREIAQSEGARVETHPWAGYSRQKNEAARRASHDWILSLDADEVVDPTLAASIQEVLSSGPATHDGYAVKRQGDFLGVILPNSMRASKLRGFIRLYNRVHGQWDEAMDVHEVVRVPGDVHMLTGTLLHLKALDVDDFIVKFKDYATAEAHVLRERGTHARYRDLTLRPVARFCWHFFMKGEWRFGRLGAVHSGIKALSDFVRYAKLYELERGDRGGS